jgi:hypothetical protein
VSSERRSRVAFTSASLDDCVVSLARGCAGTDPSLVLMVALASLPEYINHSGDIIESTEDRKFWNAIASEGVRMALISSTLCGIGICGCAVADTGKREMVKQARQDKDL